MRLVLPWRREMVCRQAVALVTDYLEGALSAPKRARFERHLAACDGCEEYLREMRTTIVLCGRLEPESIPPEVLDGLVGVMLRYRAEEAQDGGDGAPDAGPDGRDGADGGIGP